MRVGGVSVMNIIPFGLAGDTIIYRTFSEFVRDMHVLGKDAVEIGHLNNYLLSS